MRGVGDRKPSCIEEKQAHEAAKRRLQHCHDQVERVNYAGLASSPWAEHAAKSVPAGAGSVPSFVIKGGRAAGETFANALELHYQLANLGDVRSLVVHPASTTHSQLNDEEQRSAGVEPSAEHTVFPARSSGPLMSVLSSSTMIIWPAW